MPIGKVKWFSTRLGFGFILGQDGQDIFVHWSVIEGEGFRSLRDQEEVEYDLKQGPKGYLAERVRRLGSDGHPGPRPPRRENQRPRKEAPTNPAQPYTPPRDEGPTVPPPGSPPQS
jgi:cold shock protein